MVSMFERATSFARPVDIGRWRFEITPEVDEATFRESGIKCEWDAPGSSGNDDDGWLSDGRFYCNAVGGSTPASSTSLELWNAFAVHGLKDGNYCEENDPVEAGDTPLLNVAWASDLPDGILVDGLSGKIAARSGN